MSLKQCAGASVGHYSAVANFPRLQYNDPMNILYLIFSFNTGGIERLLIDLTRKMTQTGQHVWLCVINDDYTESLLKEVDPAVHTVLLHRRPGTEGVANAAPRPVSSTREALRRLCRIIREEKIDILHCQGVNCVLFAAPAKLRHPGLRVINTVHDQGNYSSYSKGKIFLSNRLLDATVAISDSVRREILSRHLNPEKVVTIYNAIDTDRFHCEPACSGANTPLHKLVQISASTAAAPNRPSHGTDTNSAIARSSSSSRRIELGNVARFYPAKKGQDLLVRAAELLLPEFPELHCSFAGEVYKGQEEAFQKLQDYIQSHGLADHITFLGNVEDVPSFLHNCDLFVLPSRYEGFGISLIEALACGIPAVASNLDGPAEIMQGEKTVGRPAEFHPGDPIASTNLEENTDERLGLLFEPGNAEDLARALRTAILRLRNGFYRPEEISRYAVSHFNIETMTEQHLALYRKLLHHR